MEIWYDAEWRVSGVSLFSDMLYISLNWCAANLANQEVLCFIHRLYPSYFHHFQSQSASRPTTLHRWVLGIKCGVVGGCGGFRILKVILVSFDEATTSYLTSPNKLLSLGIIIQIRSLEGWGDNRCIGESYSFWLRGCIPSRQLKTDFA